MKLLEIYENMLIEAGKIKPGSPEELIALLDLLPVNETAKYLSDEIYHDIIQYYTDDVTPPNEKKYTYYPEEKCLKPYELTIGFQRSNNMTAIGYSDENSIQLKYLNKTAPDYKYYNGAPATGNLARNLFHIIKHECGHFYLGQKGVEECLYNTHPDGMKKYYQDRQELVLHSREIFDRFDEDYPNWKKASIEAIIKRLKDSVKNLPNHTNIYAPYNAGTQKKYLNFILNNYIKPYLIADIENKGQ